MIVAGRSNFLTCGSILSRRSITTTKHTSASLSANSVILPTTKLKHQLSSSFHHWPGLPAPQIFEHLQQQQPIKEPPTSTKTSTTTTTTTSTTKNSKIKMHTNDFFSTWIGEGTGRKHASFGISQYAASSGFVIAGCSVIKFLTYGE